MTKEQTSSWEIGADGKSLSGKILQILSWQQVITNQGASYTGGKDWALNQILNLISQEKEKWVKQTEKDIIKIIEEWTSTPDEEAKMKTYVADYFNLLQNN